MSISRSVNTRLDRLPSQKYGFMVFYWQIAVGAIAFGSSLLASFDCVLIALTSWCLVYLASYQKTLDVWIRKLKPWQLLLLVIAIIGLLCWLVDPVSAQVRPPNNPNPPGRNPGGGSFLDPLKTKIDSAFTEAGAATAAGPFRGVIDIILVTLGLFGIVAIFYGIYMNQQGFTVMDSVRPLAGILIGCFGCSAFLKYIGIV